MYHAENANARRDDDDENNILFYGSELITIIQNILMLSAHHTFPQQSRETMLGDIRGDCALPGRAPWTIGEFTFTA
jgi:hypothetical protein